MELNVKEIAQELAPTIETAVKVNSQGLIDLFNQCLPTI